METIILILLITLIIVAVVGIIVLKKRTNVVTDSSSLEKDFLIKEKERIIAEKETQIAEKDKSIALKEEEVKNLYAQIADEKSKFSAIEQRLNNSLEVFDNQRKEQEKLKESISEKDGEIRKIEQFLANEKAKNAASEEIIKRLQKDIDTLREEQKETIDKLKTEFQNVANEVLKKQSNELSDTNKQKLNEILNPLKTDIDNFKKKVEESQEKNKEQFDVFGEKVQELQKNANKISQEANNLADALKGQKKIQGNWGETILKQILENAGLIKGENYELQKNVTDENNDRFIPDCIIYLPDDTAFVIDSKVSLNAYSQYFATEDAKEQEEFARMHTAAIRRHIDELAAKKYETLKGKLDFVFMFIPIEPAYLLAINIDSDLLNYAYKQKVILTSTTTVMTCIKMVDDLWIRQEQDKNVAKIIKGAQGIYEKLVSFAKSLDKVGTKIDAVKTEYDTVLNHLNGQKGLIKKAQRLDELGIKARKKLPGKFLELPDNDSEYTDYEEV
jgi:DNA recombination protein RmuC